jgi:hypothetical protein
MGQGEASVDLGEHRKSFLEICRSNVEGLAEHGVAEPQSMDHGQETRKSVSESTKRPSQDRARKAPESKVALASEETLDGCQRVAGLLGLSVVQGPILLRRESP